MKVIKAFQSLLKIWENILGFHKLEKHQNEATQSGQDRRGVFISLSFHYVSAWMNISNRFMPNWLFYVQIIICETLSQETGH